MSLFRFTPSAKHIEVKVPGKLFISGEYAVLEPKHPAIVMSVDQYMSGHLTPRMHGNEITIYSPQIAPEPVRYLRRHSASSHIEAWEGPWRYVFAAIELFEELLISLDIPLMGFKLEIQSELHSKDGRKLGLGSSSAAVLTTLRAMANLYNMRPFNAILLYKMAALVLLRLGSRGSFGDIAAEAIGGFVYYVGPDKEWIQTKWQQYDISEVIAMDWKDLQLESLPILNDLMIAIGWTQTPASTEDLVGQLQAKVAENPSPYRQFIQGSRYCVEQMREAFVHQKPDIIAKEAQIYNQLLQYLQLSYQINIISDSIEQLIIDAQKAGFQAKSSGAGGGDCGIALSDHMGDVELLHYYWSQHGIELLPFGVAPTS